MVALHQGHSRRDNGREEENEIFRPRAISPDGWGAEAALKTSSSTGIEYASLSVLLVFPNVHLQTVKDDDMIWSKEKINKNKEKLLKRDTPYMHFSYHQHSEDIISLLLRVAISAGVCEFALLFLMQSASFA